MTFNQVYELTNTVTKEVLGETAVVNEDLSNLVDIGTAVFNANALDKYVNTLVDHIGRVIFVDRTYRSTAPKVLRDGWEYGQVLQKIDASLPEATENETWELTNGTSYDPNIFTKPEVTQKFYSKRVTFEIAVSIPTKQAKGAFSNAEQMGRFISMIFVKVNNALTLRVDKLILSTIASDLASTYNSDIGASTASETSGTKAINLLKLYNDYSGKGLTVANCLRDLDFLKFASEKIIETSDRLTNYSTLYNVGKTEKFTPKDLQHIVLLSEFKRCSDMYLESPTYHNELVALPNAEIVNYWQGSGTDYSFSETSKIDVKDPEGNSVTINGVLGTIFDRDALGVCCQEYRTTSHYNEKAEFTNYWFKFEAGYFNDLNENAVIFFIA